MRRDMEYCISLLRNLALEGIEDGLRSVTPGYLETTETEAIENEKFLYHILILKEAGLIKYSSQGYDNEQFITGLRLTWDGNDFLDMIENDSLWNITKETAKERGVELLKLPLDMIVSYTRLKASEILGIGID